MHFRNPALDWRQEGCSTEGYQEAPGVLQGHRETTWRRGVAMGLGRGCRRDRDAHCSRALETTRMRGKWRLLMFWSLRLPVENFILGASG